MPSEGRGGALPRSRVGEIDDADAVAAVGTPGTAEDAAEASVVVGGRDLRGAKGKKERSF